MSSLADAITRAYQKQKDSQDIIESNKSPEQKKADEEARLASYKKAKEKLGYGESGE